MQNSAKGEKQQKLMAEAPTATSTFAVVLLWESYFPIWTRDLCSTHWITGFTVQKPFLFCCVLFRCFGTTFPLETSLA